MQMYKMQSTDLGTLIETFIAHILLLKNPQYLPNHYETLLKLMYILISTLFSNWVKIVDFLIKAYLL